MRSDSIETQCTAVYQLLQFSDMLDVRSNKVWDEEVAGLPGVVENSNETAEIKEKRAINFLEQKTDGDIGSLAGAEAVQATTDERRRKEVMKSKIENK